MFPASHGLPRYSPVLVRSASARAAARRSGARGVCRDVLDELYQLGANLSCYELITLAVRMDTIVSQHVICETSGPRTVSNDYRRLRCCLLLYPARDSVVDGLNGRVAPARRYQLIHLGRCVSV